jgi:hypothetical protein
VWEPIASVLLALREPAAVLPNWTPPSSSCKLVSVAFAPPVEVPENATVAAPLVVEYAVPLAGLLNETTGGVGCTTLMTSYSMVPRTTGPFPAAYPTENCNYLDWKARIR